MISWFEIGLAMISFIAIVGFTVFGIDYWLTLRELKNKEKVEQ